MAYAAEYGIYSPGRSFLAISPMCHGAGFAFAFNALFTGGVTEIMTKFEPEAVLRRIHSGEVTGLFTVPTHYHGIFGLEEKLLSSLRGNRLAGIVANAAPLSDEAKLQILDYFGEDLLHETYGSTEAGCVTNLRPKDQRRKSRCVGCPSSGTRCRSGTIRASRSARARWESCFPRSPYLFNGYWSKTEQTDETLRDGWVGVGDMAVRDEEGFYHIVDRKKDMVISGGLNIYPREVETVIDGHPGVKESAVIGVPNARWGEQLVAYVVSETGAPPADLADLCKSALAPYKLPKVFALSTPCRATPMARC